MKTLYVSDLDGTLMQPDATISLPSVETLNELISRGALFTIATARTPATVAGILRDVKMSIPGIVMTGAALWDKDSGHYTRMRYFDADAVSRVIDIYRATDTPTFIFTLDHDMVDIYFIGSQLNELQQEFVDERIDSPYKTFHIGEPIPDDLSKVVLLYTMIPDAKAADTYEKTRLLPGIRAQYYHDIYGPEIGILEAFSDQATKALAMRSLADTLGVERIVCFGDNINDLPMMAVADVAVAVENALPQVKVKADIVIGSNTADSVVKFIREDFLMHNS
ncbi:MAG: HAD-IIB family hydrolase [Lepagella sp.]